ncbi:unnamed protein product [Rhizophagus irregularis]|uniref:Reelin domain-containing protein n=1 Tax=Rhizophagus irregularis TaxID=588596 RepID=A0A2I1GJ82_9GLOM|nr:hypothetical protein RhiirA4_420815 [Rhizophagus irregularis]CAB4407852.1 unnamed protein product [Rhizophagus irregularis]
MVQTLIIFAIAILVLSPTFTHSADNSTFSCQDGTSQSCCSQLAHRVSSEHNSRCASIVLTNKSGYNMDSTNKNLEDGRWLISTDYFGANSVNITCEPHSFLDNESETISSVTSHALGGLKGYVSFKINDSRTSEFTISWKVPTIGPPQYEFNFLNDLSNQYYIVNNNKTFEDTVYQITINKINKINENKTPISFIVAIVLLAIGLVVIGIFFIASRFARPPIRVIPGPPADYTREQHIRPGPPAER